MLHAPSAASVTTETPRLPALEALGVQDYRTAFVVATREIERAPACGVCPTLHDHLVANVGSVLFLDDDPHQLATLFHHAPAPTVRQLAAAIILYGRQRVNLYPHG